MPLIFEPYAADLARRIRPMNATRVLETAAGTGVATRALAGVLDTGAELIATDLNPSMLDEAAAIGTPRPVQWQQADAMALPFEDGSFDAVVCQFGTMFFPDKPAAFAEARRVLRPGGALLFNVWDRIGENEFADIVTDAMASMFPDDPPRFLARTPHGYHDCGAIERDLAAAGFAQSPQIVTIAARSRARSPRIPALAYCEGTPLRNEIEARDASRLHEAVDVADRAIAQRFGSGTVDGKISAHVVVVRR